jgi:glycosyltransferase involved in cell wall biosynthesis
LPVIEALSRGKRVIAADATALSELGTLFGTDAVTIVDPFDPAKWARAIVDVAKRPTLPAVKVPKSIPKDWNDFHARLLAAAGR